MKTCDHLIKELKPPLLPYATHVSTKIYNSIKRELQIASHYIITVSNLPKCSYYIRFILYFTVACTVHTRIIQYYFTHGYIYYYYINIYYLFWLKRKSEFCKYQLCIYTSITTNSRIYNI